VSRRTALLGAAALGVSPFASAQSPRGGALAFPGAVGFARTTPGGRGGAILRVTTLAPEGPGSLAAALAERGPRIIVFEVGGVIDLNLKTLTAREPFVTIAGQTAPSPGVTLIRGGLRIRTHDVVIRHLMVRPGDAGQPKQSGWEVDGIVAEGGDAHDIIVDQCSLSWATDENLSASGPRFTGEGVDPSVWRTGTAHCITFSRNIIAEGLSNATHAKGEHSKGSLVHDNVQDVAIVGNLYMSNMERNPLFKGGASGVIVNNLIYNAGKRFTHYNLHASEWGDYPRQAGQLAIVGNEYRAGPSTPAEAVAFGFGGQGELTLFMADNLATPQARAFALSGRFGKDPVGVLTLPTAAPLWPEGLVAAPAHSVAAAIANAGARPWDRDAIDARLLTQLAAGAGRIIDSQEEVGGYPRLAQTRAPFRPEAWDLASMEPKAGYTAR
jgi:hypothetical protein